MSWHVPTMGQSSQLRPSCVPSGKSRALIERTRGSERSCLWKRAALFCFLASLFGSWKSSPALPPFLFFPTAELESSMFLGKEVKCYLKARGKKKSTIFPHFGAPSKTMINDKNVMDVTKYNLPSSSVGFSSSTSPLSTSSIPIIATPTCSSLVSS